MFEMSAFGVDRQAKWLDTEPQASASSWVARGRPTIAKLTDALIVTASVVLLAIDAMLAILLMLNSDISGQAGVLSPFVATSLSLVGVLAVLMRRRYLVPISMAMAVLAVVSGIVGVILESNWVPSFAALFAFAVLSAQAVKLEPATRAILVVSVSVVGVGFIAASPMSQTPAALIYMSEFGLTCAVGIGLYQRWGIWSRASAESAARSDERLEIARELHDTVGHHVTAMVVQAQAARHIAAQNPEAAIDALERIENAGTESMRAMRQVVMGLRNGEPTTWGYTWAEIDELLADASEAGLPIAARIDPSLRDERGPLASAVLRILTESLTNVRRHGESVTRIEVTVLGQGDDVVVSVHDDGLSAGTPGHDAFGLVGMGERAEALGGTFWAGSAPGGGWLVKAVMPRQARS